MKKFKSKLVLILIALTSVILLGLTGCTGYDLIRTDDFDIGYSKRESFIAAYYWYGGDTLIEIPDEYNGSKITELGGYYGRGVPCSFRIVLCNMDFDWSGSNSDDEDAEYETLVFTVKLGKNIKGLHNISGKDYYGIDIEKDGMLISDALYKVVYHFEVDPENQYLYSVDGKLYYKQNNQLIEGFYYE